MSAYIPHKGNTYPSDLHEVLHKATVAWNVKHQYDALDWVPLSRPPVLLMSCDAGPDMILMPSLGSDLARPRQLLLLDVYFICMYKGV